MTNVANTRRQLCPVTSVPVIIPPCSNRLRARRRRNHSAVQICNAVTYQSCARGRGGVARRARDARKGAATAFDQVASPLQSADFGTDSASTGERQILITDLIDSINIYPDQVTVQVVGA